MIEGLKYPQGIWCARMIAKTFELHHSTFCATHVSFLDARFRRHTSSIEMLI
jgi:hypothetical protein